MKKTPSKGFTLIELLVVIAIIGILSAVVLASLTSARTKGQDSAVQASLSNMRAQGELYYANSGNTYNTTGSNVTSCTTTGTIFTTTTAASTSLANLITGAEKQNGSVSLACRATAASWAVSSQLSGSNGHFCVDSVGNAITRPTGLTTTQFLCQ